MYLLETYMTKLWTIQNDHPASHSPMMQSLSNSHQLCIISLTAMFSILLIEDLKTTGTLKIVSIVKCFYRICSCSFKVPVWHYLKCYFIQAKDFYMKIERYQKRTF
ncbi:uncharacterized protein LOC111640007 isoform X2 [Centruroides sculpturatus]|uniref:uncharacterized protein LOC111640007 isoform X2 n=1 Tax=Centruroides sculpturatus TaxID=218467 RepID=UPI000C6D8B29|nr:uncharacterized protein LOC111640007 isoform X2 [Centruroides sculpturatus]